MRLDADVIAWLKKPGKGYQTRANRIRRQRMLDDIRGREVVGVCGSLCACLDSPVSSRLFRVRRIFSGPRKQEYYFGGEEKETTVQGKAARLLLGTEQLASIVSGLPCCHFGFLWTDRKNGYKSRSEYHSYR
jgi:hypothetical protein